MLILESNAIITKQELAEVAHDIEIQLRAMNGHR